MMNPAFQKMPVINPQRVLVGPQTEKIYPAWIVDPQPQTQTSQNSLLW
jgi:hypothetical protein